MFRLQADKGGTLEGSFAATGHTVSYPASIGAFSPASIVGQWDSPGTTVAMAYTWDSLRLPNNVEFEEIPHDQFTTLLTQTVSVNFTADQEVIPIVVGLAGNSSWQSAMVPYLEWFRAAHPGPPSYCPSGPLMYFVGSNDMQGYNHTTHRYAPNSTLQGVFNTVESAAAMKAVGIDRFGVWDTALYSQYLTKDGIPCEFNPDIELLDPNLDAAWNRSAISAFAAAYSSAGMGVFHFARPCLEIVGAQVEYGPAPGEFNVTAYGTCQVADLRNNSAQAQRQMQRLADLVDRGVTGFYLDAMSCPGDIDFLNMVRQRWPKLFLVKEGCRDIDAMLWAQIPILKLPDYPVNNSLLLRYITPLATVYGGAIDKNLNNSEFNQVLDEGYIGFVQNYPSTDSHPPSEEVCGYIAKSYANRLSLYHSYGKLRDCPQPPSSAPACV